MYLDQPVSSHACQQPICTRQWCIVHLTPSISVLPQDEKECSELPGDQKRVVFNRTPVMSTYLLAFIVGEFEFVEDRDSNGVLIRVFTPIGKKEQGHFALDVSVPL